MKKKIVAQNKNENDTYRCSIYIYFSIFFVTMALFVYETLLTRLFSVILSYNLVFIVVSVAILGGGIGAILSYNILKKKRSIEKILIWVSGFLPISFITSISVMYFFTFTPTFIIYIPVALLPFILGGMITSIIFKEKVNSSNKLYLMDLFGAGLGSLLIIALMNSYGFLRTIIIVSALGLVSAISISLYYKKVKITVIFSTGLILISILFFNNNLIKIIGSNFYAYYTSPIKIINGYQNSNNDGVEILFSKWDSISRTDVIDIENENEKYIVTDGGAAAPIVKFDGNLDSIQQMKSEVNYIPFSFGKNEKSLVVGSGGGKDVLFALLGGNKKIDAVEINPSTIVASNEFKEFSGDIYNYPGVNLYNQDGRYFIQNNKDKYDNIYLSMVMTNSVENTMYSLAEYYIFTEEAFNEYFNHLSKNGKLSFMAHNSEDLIKIVNTGIKVLMSKGIKEEDVTNYFIIVNGVDKSEENMHESKIAMPLVIFKNEPFNQDEINSILETGKIQKKDIIHYPGNEATLYKSLKNKEMSYDELINEISFNSRPITDDSPFFNNKSKFVPTEMISIIISILGIWMIIRKKFLNRLEHKKISKYFSLLGIGYMLIEIPLIQKMVLYFGSSSIAFSFIVFSLLISSGIGSLISGTKMFERIISKSSYYIIAAAITIVINQLGLNFVLNITQDWQMIYKFFGIFLYIFPMGFFMGMPFPLGIKKLGNLKKDEGLVPLMIGINSIFSVLGSTLAVVLSMKLGFTLTIYIGAAVYFMLFILNPLKNPNTNN